MAQPRRLRAELPTSPRYSRPLVTDNDPMRLLEKLRSANHGGDVHLIGGPQTIEAYRAIGALDTLALVVLPLLSGGGMQLTPSISPDIGLKLEVSGRFRVAGGSRLLLPRSSGSAA